MNIQSNTINFTLNPNVTSSVHDQGIVLLHIANGYIFSSNTIGARIWLGVEGGQPLDAIVNGISDTFHIEKNTASMHVVGFLTQLEQHALIQRQRAL